MSGIEPTQRRDKGLSAALPFPWHRDITSPDLSWAAFHQASAPEAPFVLSYFGGTGVIWRENLLQNVVLTGQPFYAICPLKFGRSEKHERAPLSAGQMVSAIRSELSLTITEVASILEVERPTIYAWLAERAEPQPRNRQRLRELLALAKQWAESSNLPAGDWVRREDETGTSVLQLLRRGEGETAAARLRAIAISAARTQPTARQTRLERLRQFTERQKLKRRPEEEHAALDVMTGKRMGPE